MFNVATSYVGTLTSDAIIIFSMGKYIRYSFVVPAPQHRGGSRQCVCSSLRRLVELREHTHTVPRFRRRWPSMERTFQRGESGETPPHPPPKWDPRPTES